MACQRQATNPLETEVAAKLSVIPRSTINKCFFVSAVVYFSLCNVVVVRHPDRYVKTFPTSAGSSSHFANSISPYTTLKMLNRGIAREKDLNVTGLNAEDGHILKHFIQDYIVFHKRNRLTKARRLVFSPSGTGIGDRFRCMLFAYWAAVVSNRVFLVAWDNPFPLQDFMVEGDPELNLFYNEIGDKPELTRGQKGAMIPDVLTVTGADLDRFEKILSSSVHTVFMNTNKIPSTMSDQFLARHKPPELTIRSMDAARGSYNFFRAVFHHVFQLSDNMEKDIENLTTKMELKGTMKTPKRGWVGKYFLRVFGKRRRPYIAVHARIGKGVGEGMSRFGAISAKLEVAAKCLASRAIRLSHMSGTPSLPIFLATDTAEFRYIFRDIVKEMSHGRIEVVSGEWDVVHSNRLKNRIHKNGTVVDVAENRRVMWSTFFDLIILGHGEHVLALYSSFPRLAAYLGDAESFTELKNEICLVGERWR